jgi:photosystem II stability/assembly factor-like uncharacterized protein
MSRRNSRGIITGFPRKWFACPGLRKKTVYIAQNRLWLRYNSGVQILLAVWWLIAEAAVSGPRWSQQPTGIDTNLRGVSVARGVGAGQTPRDVVWAAGSHGAVLRSIEGGKDFEQLKVPGTETLDFRDVEAFDEQTAYVMSSGEGEKSRIYKTADGGKNWQLQYRDQRTGFFLDALACATPTRCVALSDPVDGKFLVLSTSDGTHWRALPAGKMPPALPQEGAFAASGTAIALCGDVIYFGTGGPKARVFRSADGGETWSVTETPLASGNASSGVFSIACEGASELVAVGGNYREVAAASAVAAYSRDGGIHWQRAAMPPGGYRSGVASLGNGEYVAVGTNGSEISHDHGVHWTHMGDLNLNAAGFRGSAGWAVGPRGMVASFGRG